MSPSATQGGHKNWLTSKRLVQDYASSRICKELLYYYHDVGSNIYETDWLNVDFSGEKNDIYSCYIIFTNTARKLRF